MKVTPLSLPEVLLIEPDVFGDARGFFLETWSRERYAPLGVDDLDGVGDDYAGDDGGMSGTNRVDDPGEQVRRRQTPGGVMNQDDLVVVVQRREPCRHRGRPVRSARDNVNHDVDAGVLTGHLAGLLDVGCGRHDDHVSHLGTTHNAPQCVSQ